MSRVTGFASKYFADKISQTSCFCERAQEGAAIPAEIYYAGVDETRGRKIKEEEGRLCLI